MVNVSYFETNEINNTYVNLQTGQSLDLDRVKELKDNAMLKVNTHLWCEWDFDKNNELGLDIWKMTKGVAKKSYWMCVTCKSSYNMTVLNKHNGQGCPYCRGFKVNHTNSLASLNPKLALEWHTIKNGDLTPANVTCGKNKKVWWKCDKDDSHEWEAVINDRNTKGSGCPYCSGRKSWIGKTDIWTTNTQLASMLVNKEDGYKYKENSNKKVDWKCLGCGEIIKNKKISDICRRGLSCPKCSDNVSYPEKFIYNLLKKLNINFNFQLTNATFNWIGKEVRYDFYLYETDTIIEVHGKQHYDGGFSRCGGRTLEEEQNNDCYKKFLADTNNISHFIVIDARESKADYIKNSILNSELNELLDLSNIDWNEVVLQSEKSLVFIASELWNDGLTVYEIAEEMKLTNITVRNYLNRGIELNVCTNYNNEEARKRGCKYAWSKRKNHHRN